MNWLIFMWCGICGVVFSSSFYHTKYCNLGTLVFSEKSHYTKDLKEFCNKHQIIYEEIVNAELKNFVWVRDLFFQTESTLYLRNKNSYYANDEAFHAIYEHNQYTPASYAEEFHSYIPRQYLHQFKSFDNKMLEKYVVKSTNKSLEGGNLFACINTRGEKYYLIGSLVILYDMWINEYKSRTSVEKKIKYNSEKEVLNKYKKLFQTENILIIPNVTYHLDLAMAYIAKGHFLLNEYNTEDMPLKSKKLYEDKNKEIKKIGQLLRTNYFKVDYFEAVKLDYEDMDGNKGDNGNATSSLINGINIISNTTQENYFLTLDTHDKEHRDSFRNFLSKRNIKVKFILENGLDAEETQNKSIERAGALRCQTNILANLNPKLNFFKDLKSKSKHFPCRELPKFSNFYNDYKLRFDFRTYKENIDEAEKSKKFEGEDPTKRRSFS
ncbi:hypothetical protein EDC55_10658 [Allofrancisella inopinata]|uniref:Uncharacterized protein n=1 Tax=Allofrancisella inopinata TaxID=1085647 RepID=A0AAE6YJB9_9GAMM|nr:hypothetical protein [Allofrancisella inopinata]QIV95764.1 hypothetical protein E4K63_02515 [Allofrancisella inopinata]TDT72844.1 hypothetical protein EDC55_10658 [Allofrancisella inopinata]